MKWVWHFLLIPNYLTNIGLMLSLQQYISLIDCKHQILITCLHILNCITRNRTIKLFLFLDASAIHFFNHMDCTNSNINQSLAYSLVKTMLDRNVSIQLLTKFIYHGMSFLMRIPFLPRIELLPHCRPRLLLNFILLFSFQ